MFTSRFVYLKVCLPQGLFTSIVYLKVCLPQGLFTSRFVYLKVCLQKGRIIYLTKFVYVKIMTVRNKWKISEIH